MIDMRELKNWPGPVATITFLGSYRLIAHIGSELGIRHGAIMAIQFGVAAVLISIGILATLYLCLRKQRAILRAWLERYRINPQLARQQELQEMQKVAAESDETAETDSADLHYTIIGGVTLAVLFVLLLALVGIIG